MKKIFKILLLVVAPLPLFFDVLNLKFCIEKDFNIYTLSCGYPVPIVFIFFLILFLCNLKLLFQIVKDNTLIFFGIFLLYLLGLKIKIIILFALFFIILIYLHKNRKFINKIKYIYLLSLVLFIGLHFLYLIYNINEYLGNRLMYVKYYTRFFSIEIYQSLISYSSLLSLVFCTLIYINFIKKDFCNKINLMLIPTYHLILLSYRKLFLIEFFITFLMILILNIRNKIFSIKLILGVSIFYLFTIFLTPYHAIFKTTLIDLLASRLLYLSYIINNNELSKHILSNLSHHKNDIYLQESILYESKFNNIFLNFLFGSRYDFDANSFFITLYLNCGFIGVCILIFMLVKIYKTLILFQINKNLLNFYGLILFAGSFINYSILNIYYFTNLIIFLIITNYYLKGKYD
jgi:hypothetical protein